MIIYYFILILPLFLFLVTPYPRIFFPFTFRRSNREEGCGGGGWGETQIGERHINWLPPELTLTRAREQTCNSDMCLDQESNPRSSGAWANTLTAETHQLRLFHIKFSVYLFIYLLLYIQVIPNDLPP